MGKQIDKGISSPSSNAPAWVSIIVSVFTLWFTYVSGQSMDAKVDEALKTAKKVLADQELIRKGDPVFLEDRSIVLRDWVSSTSQNAEREGILNIRNLGGDTIKDIWVAWKPMLRPIPKEVPNVAERKAIADKLSNIETGHSELSKRILAPDETTCVMNLPNMFGVCFEHPKVPFYGSVKLGWRHRIGAEDAQVKQYDYKAIVNDGKLNLELTDFIFIRGWDDDFVDPLFPDESESRKLPPPANDSLQRR